MEAFKGDLNSDEEKTSWQLSSVNYRNSYFCKQSHQQQTTHENIKHTTTSTKNVSIQTPEIKKNCTEENTLYSTGLALSDKDNLHLYKLTSSMANMKPVGI